MIDLAGKCVLVIGAGRSGLAVVDLVLAAGASAWLVDRKGVQPRSAWPAGRVRTGGDSAAAAALAGVDLVVPSPGVARDHALLQAAQRGGVPIWSEIELASRCLTCPLVAITGTNGKSTTTVLLGNMLAAAGGRVFVGGNLGTPLAAAAAATPGYDIAVVEVSSFQLEWVERFRPRVAVWLNLTPDHMDRYRDLDDYGDAKAALFAHQQAGDVAVLNRDDPAVWKRRAALRSTVLSFGCAPVDEGAFLDGDAAVVRFAGREERYSLGAARLQGAHNRENMLAATAAAVALRAPRRAVEAGLRDTVGLPHRLELVGERRGARFFDDSKATNIGAVEKSIASFREPIVLLLGGYDKGGDFAALLPALIEHGSRVVCFGAAGPHIARQLAGQVACDVVERMEQAVRSAAQRVQRGQAVVLAPGCASFDEFRDYNERGERFRAVVETL